VEVRAVLMVAVRAAVGEGCGEGGGGEGGGEGAAVDASVPAAAAAAVVVVEDDVVARAVRGGAAPTQTMSPLSGSPHHGEPPTAERGMLQWHLAVREAEGGGSSA
jgi:hypothetical protein